MEDLLYYVMNFLPYLIAVVQCVMYIFIIVLIAKVTKPLVALLKAHSAVKADGCCCATGAEPAPVQDVAAVEAAPEGKNETEAE